MQAPKDGDAFAATWGDLKALQNDRKRLDEPEATGSTGSSFVTGNCNSPLSEAHRMHDAFTRGFIKGLHPLSHAQVKVDSQAAADYTVYRMGESLVRVSGLELVQAADPEALGHAKGHTLRNMVMGAGAPLPDKHWQAVDIGQGVGSPFGAAMADALAGGVGCVRMSPAEMFSDMYLQQPDAPIAIPVPEVLGWSGNAAPEGGYGVVTLGIEGVAVRYVPALGSVKPGVSDFDHWYASPYTRVYERQAKALHARLHSADLELSRVLHELAGEASLCWEPKPVGVFDSSAAITACERAIGELRAILRGV